MQSVLPAKDLGEGLQVHVIRVDVEDIRPLCQPVVAEEQVGIAQQVELGEKQRRLAKRRRDRRFLRPRSNGLVTGEATVAKAFGRKAVAPPVVTVPRG